MRILILGATGPCGLLLIQKCLQVYPESTVVIYARTPSKLPPEIVHHASVVIIKGSLDDPDTFSTAVEGIDVVLSALGPSAGHPKNTPLANGYKLLINLMHQHNVSRLIALGTPSCSDEKDHVTLKYQIMIQTIRTLAHTAYVDIRACSDAIRQQGGDLEWTLARVPVLTNSNSEEYIAGYMGDGKAGSTISRKAFAAFVVEEIGKREWVRMAPLISSP